MFEKYNTYRYIKIMGRRKSSEVENLSPKQYKAICMLVAGYDVQHVADELGVQRQAVHRWSEKHTFKSQLNDAVFRVYDAAIAELINSAEYASKELIRIIKDDKTPPRVKVSAINSLLNFATKAKEHYIQESSNNYIDIEVDSYE